jgi:hypothetical protein
VQVLGHVSQTNAVIYSDDGVTITGNPLTTDSSGRYQFYVANGRYDIKITATGFTPFTLSDVDIHDETDITVPGETALPGNLIFTGANSHSGVETFTGAIASIGGITCKTFENIQCVDSNFATTWSPATDIGAAINAAYTALPSTGGTIWVFPNASGTCYNYTTPIVFGTNLKKVRLVGYGASATCLNFTPSSGGPAVIFDTGSKHTAASGFENIFFQNSAAGSTATGIQLGVTSNGNGEDQFKASNSTISGFKILVTQQGNGSTFPVFNYTFDNVIMGPCSTATGSIGFQHTQVGDNDRIINSNINGCITDVVNTAAGDLNLVNVSLEGGNGTVTGISQPSGGGITWCSLCHFENGGNGAPQPYVVWFNIASGQLNLSQSVFIDDATSGSLTQYGTVSGSANLNMNASKIFSAGETATQFITFSGSATGYLSGNLLPSVAQIPTLWNNSYAGGSVIETGTNNGSANVTDFFPGHTLSPLSLTFQGALANPSGPTATVYNQAGIGLTLSGNLVQIRAGSGVPTTVAQFSNGSAQFSLPPIPSSAGGVDLGATSVPWGNLWIGTAATNNFKVQPAATSGTRTWVVPDWGTFGLATQQQPATVALHTAYTNATTTFSTLGDGTRTVSFPVAANVDYTLSCKLFYQGSATTAGPKVQLTGPASPTAVILSVDGGTNATVYADAGATAFSTPVTAFGTLGAATTNFTLHIEAGIANGANAGTVALQLAANGAGTLTVQPGSYCRIQ